MKIRHKIILILITILLTACNFTLAADVTPPPGYIPPTPMPTLGPLFPAQAPSIEDGAAIYVEKCSPCHGDTGLGDGAQGKQLPVTVPAFALPATASNASLAQWFTTVSQGNMQRYMPPFTSLDEQQRWDVVSYALTLHTKPEQISKGKALFDVNCANCSTAFFTNQKKMAALSEIDLARIIKIGNGEVSAFGSKLTDDEVTAVAMYLRSLTFATAPTPTSTVVPVTPTAAASVAPASTTEADTPLAQATPLESATQPPVPPEATGTLAAGFGNVSGVIENKTGTTLPSDLKVTLRGFDHGTDPNSNTGPQEVLTLEGVVAADGTYKFDNVQILDNRIFLAEITQGGVTYQSGYGIVKAGTTDITLPNIVLYPTTDDFKVLSIDSLQIFFDYANTDNVQFFAVYTITNSSDKSVVVKIGNDQQISFVALPEGATNVGYQKTQDSAPFISTTDGFALPPSQSSYGLIAFGSLPKDKEIEIKQSMLMPVATFTVLLPEGVTAKGDKLIDHGIQAIQQANFQVYEGGSLAAGDTVTFTLSGTPKGSSTTTTVLSQNKTLLIGVGALGIVLILAGVWMFMRDRKRVEDEADEEDEFDDSESIMDAIIALDDLHRAGKLNDEAYRTRRDELKEKLKERS